MNVSVTGMAARLYADTVLGTDAFCQAYIFRDLCPRYDHIALLLRHALGLHALKDCAAHRPHRRNTLRRVGNVNVDSSGLQCRIRRFGAGR